MTDTDAAPYQKSGFTTISSELDPRKVADLLDRLYTKFDNLSHQHELFKVRFSMSQHGIADEVQ